MLIISLVCGGVFFLFISFFYFRAEFSAGLSTKASYHRTNESSKIIVNVASFSAGGEEDDDSIVTDTHGGDRENFKMFFF